MTVLALFPGLQFRKGFAKWRKEKNRVVAETLRSARGIQNFPVHLFRNGGECATAANRGNHANEIRVSIRGLEPLHFEKQFGNFLFVAVPGPSVARGKNSRRSTQCRPHQSR